MARLPAKLRRVHVRRAAIGGDRNNQQVGNRGHQHNVNAVAEHPVVEIDLGELGRNLPCQLQLSPANVYTDRNQHQSGDEQCR